jgi:hypothetical protein
MKMFFLIQYYKFIFPLINLLLFHEFIFLLGNGPLSYEYTSTDKNKKLLRVCKKLY